MNRETEKRFEDFLRRETRKNEAKTDGEDEDEDEEEEQGGRGWMKRKMKRRKMIASTTSEEEEQGKDEERKRKRKDRRSLKKKDVLEKARVPGCMGRKWRKKLKECNFSYVNCTTKVRHH